jgi:hypothetical protein
MGCSKDIYYAQRSEIFFRDAAFIDEQVDAGLRLSVEVNVCGTMCLTFCWFVLECAGTTLADDNCLG